MSLPSQTSTLAQSQAMLRKGDDTVGNPRRAQISRFEFVELILLLSLDKQFSIEHFEPTVSRSTVPSPSLTYGHDSRFQCWRSGPDPGALTFQRAPRFQIGRSSGV